MQTNKFLEEELNKIVDKLIESTKVSHTFNNFKVVLKADMVTNSVVNDEAEDEKDRILRLADEIDIKRNFKCLVCKNIPIKPVRSCQKCEGLYCGDQCYEKMKIMLQQKESLEGKVKKQFKYQELEEEQTDEEKVIVVKQTPEQSQNFDGLGLLFGEEQTEEIKKEESKVITAVPKEKEFKCVNKKCCGQFETVPISRMINNLIQSFKFKHPSSEEDLTYEQYIDTEKKQFQQNVTFSCPKNCSLQNVTLEDLKTHLLKDCPQIRLRCKDCNFNIRRQKFESHLCTDNLKMKFEELEKEFNQISKQQTNLLQQVDFQTKELSTLKEQTQKDQKYQTWIKEEVISGFVKETLQDQIVQYQLQQDDFKYKKITTDQIISEKIDGRPVEQLAPEVAGETSKAMNVILPMKIDQSDEYHSCTFVIDLPKKIMINLFSYKIKVCQKDDDLQEVGALEPEVLVRHSDCPLKISISAYNYFEIKAEDKEDHQVQMTTVRLDSLNEETCCQHVVAKDQTSLFANKIKIKFELSKLAEQEVKQKFRQFQLYDFQVAF